jgi:hypothetical protein
MRRHFPEPLSAEADDRLRIAIAKCCSGFLTQRARLLEGQTSAKAIRHSERLAKGLRMAVDAWASIGKIRDDRCGILDDRRGLYKTLELMAREAEDRLAQKPVTVPNPWPEFVRKVDRCCREVGLKPTTTGRVYGELDNKPTWFQKFMATLNANVLGDEGQRKKLKYSRAAFYAEIAKALGGYKKSGKARK